LADSSPPTPPARFRSRGVLLALPRLSGERTVPTLKGTGHVPLPESGDAYLVLIVVAGRQRSHGLTLWLQPLRLACSTLGSSLTPRPPSIVASNSSEAIRVSKVCQHIQQSTDGRRCSASCQRMVAACRTFATASPTRSTRPCAALASVFRPSMLCSPVAELCHHMIKPGGCATCMLRRATSYPAPINFQNASIGLATGT
jgi:hypothetical protein